MIAKLFAIKMNCQRVFFAPKSEKLGSYSKSPDQVKSGKKHLKFNELKWFAKITVQSKLLCLPMWQSIVHIFILIAVRILSQFIEPFYVKIGHLPHCH